MKSIQSKIKQAKITEFEKAVYLAVAKIPRGQVATYGEVARRIGRPGSARAVGNALNKNPFAPEVPCHRVIKSNGSIGGFASGSDKKRDLLASEGVNLD